MFRLALTSRGRRRLLIAGIVVGSLAVLVLVGLFVVYPRVGEWMVRSKVTPKLEAKLGRKVSIGDVDVSLGHATLRDVVVRGPNDGDAPMVTIERVEIEFATFASMFGTPKIEDAVADGVAVDLRRTATGDNFTDLAVKLGLRRPPPGETPPQVNFGKLRPDRARARRIKMTLVDDTTGTKMVVGDGDAELAADRTFKARLASIAVTTTAGPGASIGSLALVRPGDGGDPTITVIGGEARLWPRLALTGISGTIAPNGEPGRYDVDLAGGYGGVEGTLWTAQGWIDPGASIGAIDATAEEFTFGRIAPILENSPVKHFDETRIDARLHVDIGQADVGFTGSFHLAGLNVGHPLLAEEEVRGLDLAGDIAGTYTRASRTLVLEKGTFESRDLPFDLSGWWAMPGGTGPAGDRRSRHAIDVRFNVPPIPCQTALDSFPREMIPHLVGYKLKGTFRTWVHVAVDMADVQKSILDGSVRLRDCKVTQRPEESLERLLEPFEHFVELDQDEWVSFVVGPENPDFVPLAQVSPYLIKSLMTTEDGGFYTHKGFIVREFQSAMIKDLEAGYFKYGASSITMQLVKNVLLYREKTLARKLQELFLTWDIENVLSKDRIMEIYVNVIEYGPALYGIGPAAKHYFGKLPRDIDPVEAAFFSSILPGPKQRYKQYCEGTLTKWTSGKIERIIALMWKRGRITEEEYQKALATPLLFNKDGTESEQECLQRTIKAIKGARSTNPLKKKQKQD
jgi:hypothetical protein